MPYNRIVPGQYHPPPISYYIFAVLWYYFLNSDRKGGDSITRPDGVLGDRTSTGPTNFDAIEI